MRVVCDTNVVRFIHYGDKYPPEAVAAFRAILQRPGFECAAAQEVIVELAAPLKDRADPETVRRVHSTMKVLQSLSGTRLAPMRPNRFRMLLPGTPELSSDRFDEMMLTAIEALVDPVILGSDAYLQTVRETVASGATMLVENNQDRTGDMYDNLEDLGRKRGEKPEQAARALERKTVRERLEPQIANRIYKSARLDPASAPAPDLSRACTWVCALVEFFTRKSVPLDPESPALAGRERKRSKLNTGSDLSILTTLFDPEVVLVTDDEKLRDLVGTCPHKERVLGLLEFVAKYEGPAPEAKKGEQEPASSP